MMQAIGSEAQCSGRTVRASLRATAQLLASCDLAAGTEAEPRGEVLRVRPAGHVEPDLTDHLHRGMRLDAFDRCEVDSGDAEEMSPRIESESGSMLSLLELLGRGFSV